MTVKAARLRACFYPDAQATSPKGGRARRQGRRSRAVGKWAGTEVLIDGQTRLILKKSDIWA
jgi:hypothetical protein